MAEIARPHMPFRTKLTVNIALQFTHTSKKMSSQ